MSPQKTNTTPLKELFVDGLNSKEWDSARDASRLAVEFNHYEIEPAGNAIGWKFSPKDATGTSADMYLRRAITLPFKEMVLRVRNLGAAFAFCVKIVDQNGAEYSPEPFNLTDSDEWRDVRFTLSQFRVSSWSKDANGRFDWPAQQTAAIAFGITQNTEYQIELASITLLRDEPVHVSATATIPATAAAGKVIIISGAIRPEKDFTNDAVNELQLLKGQTIVARVPVSLPTELKAGQRASFGPVKLMIPEFAWTGEHTVRLRVGNMVVDSKGGGGVLGKIKLQGRKASRSIAEVKPHKGVPTLFLNGQPNAAISYMSYNPQIKYFTQFGQAGVHLYTFSSTPSEAGYFLAKEVWTAPNMWDYSQVDERSMMVLSSDPQAHFFPRLYLRAPKWWCDQHPDEMVTYDKGDGKPIPFIHNDEHQVPSWSSEVWRKDTAEAIRRYIRHMEQSPWADRVVGYHVASGTTEEWMMWGGNEDQWVDYSRPNRDAFHRWLKEKYGSVEVLRTAWGDPAVTFENAPIPTRAQRSESALYTLHDPAKAQSVIDYSLYTSDLVAETIAYFGKVIKEATRREKLVGAFYGYVLQLTADQRQQNAGHLAMDKLLACPDVDFMTSPSSYAFRTAGTGFSHFMSLTDSIKAHGKLWMDENDYRTWLTGGKVGEFGQAATYEESLLQQKRELGNVLGHGCGMWWFDMGGGWFDDPRMMREIGDMAAIANKTVDWDRSPVDQIAYVLDPRSLAWLRTGNILSGPMIMEQLPQLGHVGAPFGTYMLDDIELIPPHRMYVFISCVAPTAKQRQMIDRVVKRDGRMAVWIFAPGVYTEGKLDPAGMESLTGISLKMLREQSPCLVKLNGTDPLLAGLASGTNYGTDYVTGPVIYADDPKAQVLGTIANTPMAGLAVRRYPEWTSVYSSAPIIPTALLRNLARAAGVHLYTEGGETVYANRSVLSVSVNEGGVRTVRLPRPARVTQLFTGKLVGSGISEFKADIEAKGTGLYHLE